MNYMEKPSNCETNDSINCAVLDVSEESGKMLTQNCTEPKWSGKRKKQNK